MSAPSPVTRDTVLAALDHFDASFEVDDLFRHVLTFGPVKAADLHNARLCLVATLHELERAGVLLRAPGLRAGSRNLWMRSAQ